VDVMLLGVVSLSLAVALIASAIAWRLAREERTRSAARVAALAVAADEADKPAARVQRRPANAPLADEDDEVTSRSYPSRVTPLAAGSRGFGRGPELALRADPDIEVVAARTDPAPGRAELRESFLGAGSAEAGPNGRQRWLAGAALVLLLVLGGATAWMFFDTSAASHRMATAAAAPLELLSLRHERRGSTLAISGLVRNPVAGHAVAELSAVVFLFDQGGTFVRSAQARVDFLKLGAGDESPFVIQVEAPATVTRYRVSFRTGEGMVPHVDRREQPQVSPASVELNRPSVRE
jgi:hypothetical protein